MPDQGPIRLLPTADGVLLAEIDNRPANALDATLYAAIADLVQGLREDDSTRALVLASSHPAIFVSGADLKGFDRAAFAPAAVRARSARAQEAFSALEELPIPTVAALEGHALGGGCELALALDFRFMSEGKARIGLPEAALGLIPGAGGTQRLPRLVGRARAAEMTMLAQRLSAVEAERIGLVTAACEDARAEALGFAARLAAMPATSLRLIKRCLAASAGDLADGLAVERASIVEAFGSDDAREGVAAFLEKRRPAFGAGSAPPLR